MKALEVVHIPFKDDGYTIVTAEGKELQKGTPPPLLFFIDFTSSPSRPVDAGRFFSCEFGKNKKVFDSYFF